MVHFITSDGREVHTRYATADDLLFPRPGKQIRVRYLPAHPVRFEVVGNLRTLSLVLLASFGIAFLLIGVVWAPTW